MRHYLKNEDRAYTQEIRAIDEPVEVPKYDYVIKAYIIDLYRISYRYRR